MVKLSKQETRKPLIYVAGDYQSDYEIGEAMEEVELELNDNPFIEQYYSPRISKQLMPAVDAQARGLYDLVNVEHADVVIAVSRETMPVEVGYAIAKDIPFMLVNISKPSEPLAPYSDMVTTLVHKEFTDVTELADYNFLKMEK